MIVYFVLIWVVVLGVLYTTRVIDNDLSIDKVKLIVDMPSIRDSILQHQRDAIYVPYKVRKLMFNNSVYIYQVLRNIANFWNLNNINRIMFLANIYPAIFGVKLLWLKQRERFYMSVLLMSVGSMVIGLNKMVDARAATWFMMPILSYLIIKGLNKVNLKIYVPLLVISIFLLI